MCAVRWWARFFQNLESVGKRLNRTCVPNMLESLTLTALMMIISALSATKTFILDSGDCGIKHCYWKMGSYKQQPRFLSSAFPRIRITKLYTFVSMTMIYVMSVISCPSRETTACSTTPSCNAPQVFESPDFSCGCSRATAYVSGLASAWPTAYCSTSNAWQARKSCASLVHPLCLRGRYVLHPFATKLR